MFDERQDDYDKEQRDGWETLLFPDSGLVEDVLMPSSLERLVDLGLSIEAMPLYFPLDGQSKMRNYSSRQSFFVCSYRYLAIAILLHLELLFH